MASCPYSARHFNWGEPNVPAEKMNPHTHYLGNRPNYKSVVGKCTFCVQRVREGVIQNVSSRWGEIGNITDPTTKSGISKKQQVLILRDLNTQPISFILVHENKKHLLLKVFRGDLFQKV
jgi:molybdopterin-containing oxidoreductase family iron-sulfur binding subunit